MILSLRARNLQGALRALLLLGPALAGPAPAQGPGQWRIFDRLPGNARGLQFGTSVAAVGDVDGDGVGDFAVGAPKADVGSEIGAGAVFLFSGADRRLLRQLRGSRRRDHFGMAVAGAGDLDGDGLGDILVGAPESDPRNRQGAGRASVWSGATGALLFHFEGMVETAGYGSSVAGGGDADGDGVPDLLIGAPGPTPCYYVTWDRGYVHLRSGRDGSVLRAVQGRDDDNRGHVVAFLGDLDADGQDDWLVSSPIAWSPDGFMGTGMITVRSGASGRARFRAWGPEHGAQLGQGAAGLGDVDGDGVPDFAASAPNAESGGQELGLLQVWSGASGRLLYEIPGPGPVHTWGWLLRPAGDLNGDGRPDLAITGSSSSYQPTLELRSGPDGTLLHRFAGEVDFTADVGDAAPLGDLNGDGYGELLVGLPNADPGGFHRAGLVVILGYDPFLAAHPRSLAASAGGSVVLTLDFPPDQAGAGWQLLLSASGTGPTTVGGLQVPLSDDALFQRTLAGDYSMLEQVSGALGILDATGDGRITIRFSPGSLDPVAGQSFYAAVITGPRSSGLAQRSSAAVEIQVTP